MSICVTCRLVIVCDKMDTENERSACPVRQELLDKMDALITETLINNFAVPKRIIYKQDPELDPVDTISGMKDAPTLQDLIEKKEIKRMVS